ncbi:hypothetical protein [Celeribacter baekdonensis]|uniref:hypothetical protein n=1 Tax=Celeribacter baekdonensis TaxID=875171 RepID=UPI003A8F8D36
MEKTHDITMFASLIERKDVCIAYEALMIPKPDGSFQLKHSHVAIPTCGAKAWYSDSLTHAHDWETAVSLIHFQKAQLLSAYKVETW